MVRRSDPEGEERRSIIFSCPCTLHFGLFQRCVMLTAARAKVLLAERDGMEATV